MTNPDPLLVTAVQSIAGRCDGAQSDDGIGFAGPDVAFGHALSRTAPEAWGDAATRQAWELMRKYQAQLQSVGIQFNAIVEPPAVEGVSRRSLKSIEVVDDRFLIRFSYDEDMIYRVKRLTGARFDRDRKAWTVPLTYADDVHAFAEAEGFALSNEARVAQPSENASTGRVYVRDGLIVLEFDYSAERVSEVKDIAGRSWDADRRVWTCPTDAVRQVRAFAERFGLTVDQSVADLPDVEFASVLTVRLHGQQFLLQFPYDRDMMQTVRELPGAVWSPFHRSWVVSVEAAIEVAAMLAKVEAVIDASAVETLQRASEAFSQIESSTAHDAEFEVEGLGGDLLPFQRAGVAYASRVRRTFIADEMGLGKTVQAIATLQATDAFPAVVVCPASLKLNWQREISKWLPNRTVTVVGGNRPYAVSADVVVVNYDVLGAWLDTFDGFKGVVFDESHYVKNAATKRAKATFALADKVGKDGVLLALTGTPVVNRPEELVPQLRAIHRLSDFGTAGQFRSRYAYGRYLGELNRRLRATCYVRRRKTDVLTELPPKRWSTLYVQGESRAMAEYRKAERDVTHYLAGKAREMAEKSGATEPQAKAAAWHAAMRASAAENLVMLGTLKRLALKAKMSAAHEWIDDFVSSGNKLVTFATSREVVHELSVRFADGCKIQGGMSDAERQASVDRFQNDDETKVISCSIKAAGVGLTLTAASDVLFLEQPWTPADLDQCSDRCHRIGQQDSVTAWVMLCEGTVDEDIADLIARKRRIVDAATDGSNNGMSESIVGDLLIRLAERGMAAD